MIAEIPEEDDVYGLAQYLAKFPNIKNNWRMWGRPSQFMPTGDWLTWAIYADRRFGKTRAAAEAVNEWIFKGKKKRIALLGANFSDVRNLMVEGQSGLLNVLHPDLKATYIRTKNIIEYANGAKIYLFSAEKPEFIRGMQFDGAWIEEITHHRYPQAAEILSFGLRLGNPQTIVTIDKRHVESATGDEDKFHCESAVKLLEDKRTFTSVGETLENSNNLAPGFIKTFTEKYLKGVTFQNA